MKKSGKEQFQVSRNFASRARKSCNPKYHFSTVGTQRLVLPWAELDRVSTIVTLYVHKKFHVSKEDILKFMIRRAVAFDDRNGVAAVLQPPSLLSDILLHPL